MVAITEQPDAKSVCKGSAKNLDGNSNSGAYLGMKLENSTVCELAPSRSICRIEKLRMPGNIMLQTIGALRSRLPGALSLFQLSFSSPTQGFAVHYVCLRCAAEVPLFGPSRPWPWEWCANLDHVEAIHGNATKRSS